MPAETVAHPPAPGPAGPASGVVANTLLTALTPILWGSTYLVTTEWLPPDRPFTAALIRVLPAGLALVLLHRVAIPRREWGRLALLAGLNIGFFQALLFVAAYRLPGGIAAVVGALQPLLVMALAAAFDQRRPPAVAVAAGILAIGGMALIFVGPGVHGDPVGLAAAAAGTASMAAGTYLAARWRSAVPLLPFTGWQLLVGGLILAPIAAIADPPLGPLSAENLAGFAYLSLFGALLGYPLWFRGIAKLPTTAVSALGLLSPVTAIVLGWSVLGESLSPRQLTGMTVVLGAVFFLQWAHRARPTRPAACPPPSIGIHPSPTVTTS